MSVLKQVMYYFHVYNLIFNLFASTELCIILTRFDIIQGGLKITFRLHGKNMLNYTRVEISALSLRKG